MQHRKTSEKFLVSQKSPCDFLGCQKEKNLKNCNCSYSCSKKGICCECLSSHLKNRELPACCFPDNVEKTYDRSFEKFVECVNEKKI